MSAGTSEYNSMNVTEGPILQLYLLRYILELMISAKIVSVIPLVYSFYHCDYTDVGNGALRTSSMADTLTVRVYFYQYLHPCNSSLLEFLAAKPPLGVLNFRCNQYVYSGNNAP